MNHQRFTTLLRFALAGALIVASAESARAQSVTLQFQNGMVTLKAQNAPVRAILAEWARIGGAKIVNAERVAGTPVTLELTNVREREALGIVLRNVSGYIVAARPVTTASSSVFDRILILPTSAAPRQATAQPFVTTPPAPLFVPGDPDDDPGDVVAGNRGGVVVRTPTPQQRDAQQVQQVQQQLRDAAARSAAAREAEAEDVQTPRVQPPARMPGLPPGAPAGSARPGEITPVPQQPRNPSRPGGDEP